MHSRTVRILVLISSLFFYSGAQAQALNLNLALGGDGHGMVLDSESQLLYVSVPSLNEIVKISTLDYSVLDRVVLPASPRGIDISDDGTKLYAALENSGAVAEITLENLNYHIIDIGSELGDARTYDVEFVAGNRLFVSANPSSSGFSYIVEVKLDQEYAAERVASNRIIRAAPVFSEHDSQFLYVGEGFSPNSIYKLDLNQAGAPVVAEDDHGSVSGANKLEVTPTGERVHTTSGQIFGANSLTQVASIGAGLVDYPANSIDVFVARYNDYDGDQAVTTVEQYDSATNLPKNEWTLLCPHTPYDKPVDFIALEADAGFLLLNNDRLCGLVGEQGGALDKDADGIVDVSDNCPELYNPEQGNMDGDEFGDLCDPFPANADNLLACLIETEDQSQIINSLNLENQQLKEQLANLVDSDGDGVPDSNDLCPNTTGKGKIDENGCSNKQK